MQLAQNVTEALFKPYEGGEIVLASSTIGTPARLYRGELKGVRIIEGGWLDVELTCNEYTTGELADAENPDLVWTPSSGGTTHALLYADLVTDEETGALHLHNETPQGATATVKLALVTSHAEAA